MTEYKYECVKVRVHDGIGWAFLNRPEKRNAMSPQLHFDMDDALAKLEGDENVKVVVVSGCWVGGAFMQLLGCDFAIAAENATFSLSEVNWGILPGALVSKVVADMVLPRHALYYACLGEPFDGKEAVRIGMINSAVPLEKLEAAVTDLAERLMKKSPAVLRATKHAIRQVRTMDVPQAYDYLAAKGQAIKTADKEDSYNTGLRQFLDEKSYKPTFEPFKLGTLLTDQGKS